MSETARPLTGSRHDRTELRVIPPAIGRDEVATAGRVGAVAYPYRVCELSVRIERPLVDDRVDRYVVTVDRARRLALRADTVPETESETVEDVLVLPAELSADAADDEAREAALKWTLHRYSLGEPPEISVERVVEGHKLFWLAERADGDVIVDSVRGTEEPLRD